MYLVQKVESKKRLAFNAATKALMVALQPAKLAIGRLIHIPRLLCLRRTRKTVGPKSWGEEDKKADRMCETL